MLESYVEIIVTLLYILGALSLIVSILTYFFLPKALKMLKGTVFIMDQFLKTKTKLMKSLLLFSEIQVHLLVKILLK